MKWFPYGYGSASGTNFVIEEIGEISDDEEDYSEFQEVRQGDENEIGEARTDAGGNWFNGYQTVQKSDKEVRNTHRDR